MIKIPKDTISFINREAAKRLKDDFRKKIEPRFLEIRQMMISEFLEHPVTKEIQAGPESPNLSGTLGGYGNLFSFIGFEKESDPIKPVLDILESTRLINAGISLDGTVNYRVILPLAQDVFDVTDMPWASGRSWAKGIESGISGLGYYLNTKSDKSRSSQGIQTQEKISTRSSSVSKTFKKTAYISSLMKKYSTLFSKL